MNEFTFSYWVLRPLWQLYLIWACSTAIIVITSYILVIQPTYQQWTKKQQMIVLQQQTLIQLTQTLETLPQQTELMLELQQLAPTLNDQQHNHIETQITTCLDKTGMKLFSLTQS
ncbi:MAG: hypothetical protein J6562_08385, partial [Candidatus Schmidhempelia sp.]|nr:hypothetical protein [Candidatus Schmidhempelia sp.]